MEDTTDEGAAVSSPNSAASSFRMDFSIMNDNGDARNSSREGGVDSDDEENGSTRKKLRLSKEQSAFLEETFKEHTTLNPVRTIFHFIFLSLCHIYLNRIKIIILLLIKYFYIIQYMKKQTFNSIPFTQI
jgi:hypothetical protein